MAKIIRINGCDEINVDRPVGKGGVNLREDVMVIQAMLKYALEGRSYFQGDFFPMPSGVMDKDTLTLIEAYQTFLRRECGRKVSVDGRIDPAKGIFVSDRRTLTWTISQLNAHAQEVHLYSSKGGGRNYLAGIRNMYPQVDAILSKTAVGTLSLALS
ncbi:MAG: hypothetical protein R2681_13235 [Pyrinomonadaceae bacterium]